MEASLWNIKQAMITVARILDFNDVSGWRWSLSGVEGPKQRVERSENDAP